MYIVCKSTAAEAVDDMQRMNVADRMMNGKRPTDDGGPKADHNTGPHKAANRRPQRDPHRKHTDTPRPHSEKSLDTVCGEVPRRAPQSLAWRWQYKIKNI